MLNLPDPILKPLLSKEELMTLPLFDYAAPFELVTNIEDANKAVIELQKETILGFDTETRPSFTKGEFHYVSLLQLATIKHCYLFRLNQIPIIDGLIAILENPSIIKVGVGNRDDIKGLQKRRAFHPDGFVDLAEVARISKTQTPSLRSLCGTYLNHRLSKGAKVTNWDKVVLTPQQAKYAANDAFVGLLVFQEMFPQN